MAFKKQLVTSCKQAIWGEILGGNAPNYADKLKSFIHTPKKEGLMGNARRNDK